MKMNNSLFESGIVVGFKEKLLRFMPPLIINKKDIDNLVENLALFLK